MPYGRLRETQGLARLRAGYVLSEAVATPVFDLFTLVGLVDGLVSRDLRRWGGGRESSFVYHWVETSALPLFMFSWTIDLALPFTLHPTFVVLHFAGMFALVVGVTPNRFKRYL